MMMIVMMVAVSSSLVVVYMDACTFMVMMTDNLSTPHLYSTMYNPTILCRQRGGKVREDEVCGYLVGAAASCER